MSYPFLINSSAAVTLPSVLQTTRGIVSFPDRFEGGLGTRLFLPGYSGHVIAAVARERKQINVEMVRTCAI